MWVRSADTGDNEIGVGKIETRVKPEGHDGGGGARVADAGDHAEDATGSVEP